MAKFRVNLWVDSKRRGQKNPANDSAAVCIIKGQQHRVEKAKKHLQNLVVCCKSSCRWEDTAQILIILPSVCRVCSQHEAIKRGGKVVRDSLLDNLCC